MTKWYREGTYNKRKKASNIARELNQEHSNREYKYKKSKLTGEKNYIVEYRKKNKGKSIFNLSDSDIVKEGKRAARGVKKDLREGPVERSFFGEFQKERKEKKGDDIFDLLNKEVR